MNRDEELKHLLGESKAYPQELNGSITRARNRVKRGRTGKWFAIPAASLAGLAAAFVLLVNTSIPFALACGGVPGLRGLAAAVAFSPSLKAAVENDYVQYVGVMKEDNGVSMTVEYMISDVKRVHIFYTIKGPAPQYALDNPVLLDLNHADLEGAGLSWGSAAGPEEVMCVTVDFVHGDTPEGFLLSIQAAPIEGRTDEAPVQVVGSDEPQDPEPVASFLFDLRFRPEFLQRAETVGVGQWAEVDGERLYVDSVELYPTHARLNVHTDPENTSWLRSLNFYLEDEEGNHFEPLKNGVTAVGDPDHPDSRSFWMDSSYFGSAEHLTVCIIGATWLEKGREYATVDLNAGTVQGLPDGVDLVSAQRSGNDVTLTFHEPIQVTFTPEGRSTSHRSALVGARDPDGTDHYFAQISSHHVETDQERAGSCKYTIEDYPYDTVDVALDYTWASSLTEPVRVEIR